MTVQSGVGIIFGGPGQTVFLGTFATEAALVAAHPTGAAGDYAFVTATGSNWEWIPTLNSGSGAWQDSAAAAGSNQQRVFATEAARDAFFSNNLSQLVDGLICVAGVGGGFSARFVWEGGSSPSTYIASSWITSSAIFPTGSIDFGGRERVGAAGLGYLSIEDKPTGTFYHTLGVEWSDTGSRVPTAPILDSEITIPGGSGTEISPVQSTIQYQIDTSAIANFNSPFSVREASLDIITAPVRFRNRIWEGTDTAQDPISDIVFPLPGSPAITTGVQFFGPEGSDRQIFKPNTIYTIRIDGMSASNEAETIQVRGQTVGGSFIPNGDNRGNSIAIEGMATQQYVNDQVAGIVVPTPPSFRPFRIFNGGTLVSNVNFRIEEITLDDTNFAEWNDINSIYAAGNVNKRVDILLPTDAEISASGEGYPVAIEVTHLGGTDRVPADGRPNIVNYVVKDADTATNINTVALGERKNIGIQQGDISVVVKNSAGQNWIESRRTSNPSENLLPSGVFDLQEERPIQNIANLATELSGVVITTGEAFLVTLGGTYFGANVGNGDAIVAKVNNPDLTTNSEDWLIVRDARNAASSLETLMLLNQFTRTGTRYDASRNVFVNESNVVRFSSMSSGTPLLLGYFDSAGDGIPEQRQFTSQPLQFTDLQGGTLSLSIAFSVSSQSGFAPELTSIVFDYGGGVEFTFPLTGISPIDGVATIDISIPNQDYSSVLNSDCTITLNFIFRGNTFIGSFTIMALVNTLDGSLRQAVTNIANNSALMAEQRAGDRIDRLAVEVDQDSGSLRALEPRISPYKTIQTNTPETSALYSDSTGSDPFPSDLSSLGQVSTDNPRYTGGSTALFVAVPGGNSAYTLQNITTGSPTPLMDGGPVTLGESRTFGGITYFVYRITGLTSGHIYEVDRTSESRVVAWPDDIRNLQGEVERIDSELGHAALNLPDAVVHVLEGETSVTEESTPTIVATEYNQQLAGASNTTQAVFYEPNENAASGGSKNSRPLSELTGDQVQRKLLYIPEGATFSNQASYVTAFDGTTGRDLIGFQNGKFLASVFVPAKSAGNSTETLYPAPSTRVSGAGVWQNIPALTFQNGVPVAESDELFFTRNLPTSSTTVTIQYRGHANGNVFGTAATTLAGVGGSSETFANFTLNDGSEQLDVEARWYPSTREIRVSESARVFTGLPTINDVQVILSYDETRTIPATPATTRQVEIESQHTGAQVFAFKPSSGGNLIIVGDRTEIDTGFSYTTLFGVGLIGHFTVAEETARFLNYEDFEPINTTVSDLENHAGLPQFGLFTTQYTRETLLSLGVTLQPTGLNISNIPTSPTGLASGDLWWDDDEFVMVP